MADGYNIDELRAAGLSEADIAELMGFDIAKYQADYQANQKAAEDARARGLTAAQATGLSDKYVALNDPRANDLIGGDINAQIMGRLGLIPTAYDYAPVFNIKGDQQYENYNFVPVPGKEYRLVDNNTGQVVGTATNAAEAKGLAEAANVISSKQGGNANWALQEYGSYSDGKGNMTSGYSDVYTNEKSGVMNDLKPLVQAAVVMAAVGTGLAAVTAPAAGGAGAGAAAAGAGTGAGAGAAGTGSLVSSSALASSTASNLAAISKAASSAASAAGLTGASTTLLADVGLSALRGGLTSAAMGGDPLTGALTAGLGELGSQVVGPLIQSQEVGRIGAGGNFILDGTREATRFGSAAGTALGSAAGSLVAGESLKDVALTGGISGIADYLTYKPTIKGEQLVGGVTQANLDADLLDISDTTFNQLKDYGVFSNMNPRIIDEALDSILVTAAKQTENTLGSLLTNAGTDALTTALTGSDNVFVYGQETPPGGGMDNTIKGISGDILVTGATKNDGRGRDTTVSPEDIFVNGVRVTTSPTRSPTTQAPTITVTARPTTMATTAPTTQAPTITVTARPTQVATTAPTTQAPTITVTARPTTAPTTAPTTQAPTITVTARPTTAATTQAPTVSPTYPTFPPTQTPTWGTKDWVLLGLAAPNLINRIVGKGEDVGTITQDKSAVTYNPLNRQRNTSTFDPFTYGQKGIGYQSEEFDFFKPYTMAQPEQKSTTASVTYTPGADIYEYTPAEFEKMKADANAQYAARTAAFNNFQQTLAKQVESGAMTLEQARAEARAYAEPYGGAIIQQKAQGGIAHYADGGAVDPEYQYTPEWKKAYLDYMQGRTNELPPRLVGNTEEEWARRMSAVRGYGSDVADQTIKYWDDVRADPAYAEDVRRERETGQGRAGIGNAPFVPSGYAAINGAVNPIGSRGYGESIMAVADSPNPVIIYNVGGGEQRATSIDALNKATTGAPLNAVTTGAVVNPFTYSQSADTSEAAYFNRLGMAEGGEADDDMIKHLMEYRKGGGHHGPGPVKGIGSGQEDKIPAWLSDGEYVWSAQDVADLGDGSTDEGVRRLDKMRQMVRKQAGRKDVKKIAKPQKGIDHMLKAVGGKV